MINLVFVFSCLQLMVMWEWIFCQNCWTFDYTTKLVC